MKKTLMTLAVMAMSAIAPAAVSAQNTSGICPQSQTECGKDNKVCRNNNAQCRVLDGCVPGECIFKTLNLTDDQRGKIKELNVSESTFRENMRKERKVARQANDSTMRVAAEKHQREYLNNLKQILTPDQYIKFLEESYLKSGGRKAKKEMRANVGPRGMKGAHHTQGKRIQEGRVKAGEIQVNK